VSVGLAALYGAFIVAALPIEFLYFLTLLIASLGLLTATKMYFDARRSQRSAYKAVCSAVGLLCAYTFILVLDALIQGTVFPDIRIAWGPIMSMSTPLLAVAVVRNRRIEIIPTLSRKAALLFLALLGSGTYLLAALIIGYELSTSWNQSGKFASGVFLLFSLAAFFFIVRSRRIRARVRVEISKHLFRYRHNYRRDWLRLTATLADDSISDPRERAVQALIQLMGCQWGVLWQWDGTSEFVPVTNLGPQFDRTTTISNDTSLVQFLQKRRWVIDLQELAANPRRYSGAEVPSSIKSLEGAWLVAPLIHIDALIGFAVLGTPIARYSLNWEDHDLLKTAGRQISSYLALIDANEHLVQARQFEALNRLSAYILHDLKNISAELSLVIFNSRRLRHDQQFIQDSFLTLESVASKVESMVADVRSSAQAAAENTAQLPIRPLLTRLIAAASVRDPAPVLGEFIGDPTVDVPPIRFERILGNLIQNAQEATPPDGSIRVSAHISGDQVCIAVSDTGCGMDREFTRTRLFRPFQTTKGGRGMGLGLYETRQTVEEVGGHVVVESVAGKGTVFRIYLPHAPVSAAKLPATLQRR
jgi:putative PEP-CTERM system histidine kinase